MVKGINRQVIVVKSPDPKLFDQAIFLLRNSRYNQHATTGSLLVEVGAAGNSPEEAALAGRLLAQQMVELLQAKSK